jgi:mRNA interferase MazF
VEFRWNVFLANLDPVIGSEQGKTRPVLIVSEEEVNQLLSIVNGIPITSRKEHRNIYPNEVLLNAGVAGLTRESIVLCHQIRTLDKKRLIKHIDVISDEVSRDKILEALSFQLGTNR